MFQILNKLKMTEQEKFTEEEYDFLIEKLTLAHVEIEKNLKEDKENIITKLAIYKLEKI